MNVIIVSGFTSLWMDVEKLKDAKNIVIGVDRGSLILLAGGVIPHVAIGDFDSISEKEYQQLLETCKQVITLQSDKDETDTEAAILHAVSLGATKISIYDGLGGRIDHTLANIRLLLKFAKRGIDLELMNETNYLKVLPPGAYELEPFKHRYLSFLALETDVKNLTLTGVKYPLTRYVLRQEDVRLISNEINSELFTVSFSEGYLLMMNSRD